MAEIPKYPTLYFQKAENNIVKHNRYSTVLKNKIIILTSHIEKNQMELGKLMQKNINDVEHDTKVSSLKHEIDIQKKALNQLQEKLLIYELGQQMDGNTLLDEENLAMVDELLFDPEFNLPSPLEFMDDEPNIDTNT